MYENLSRNPVIIIKPDKTLIDGYEFYPNSISIEFWDKNIYADELEGRSEINTHNLIRPPDDFIRIVPLHELISE